MIETVKPLTLNLKKQNQKITYLYNQTYNKVNTYKEDYFKKYEPTNEFISLPTKQTCNKLKNFRELIKELKKYFEKLKLHR